MNKIFSIAIDGPAGAGKSSLAKAAAKELGAMYLDTGAMYRTVGLYFHRQNLLQNREEMARRIGEIEIDVQFIGSEQHMLLNGEDVTQEIRTEEIGKTASAVGAVPEIRTRLVNLQRQIAGNMSIIMDGRDIGTVVLPNATLKLFVTALAPVRAQRRYDQLRDKFERGELAEKPVYHQILDGIVERDYNDSHRAASPLKQAEDALLVDTSMLTLQQSIDEIVRLAQEAIGG